MPKRRNKRRANIIHFQRRIYERYGIELDVYEVRDLADFIKANGRKYFIEKLSGSRTLFKIPIQGQAVLVIYDKNQHSLLTALPKYE